MANNNSYPRYKKQKSGYAKNKRATAAEEASQIEEALIELEEKSLKKQEKTKQTKAKASSLNKLTDKAKVMPSPGLDPDFAIETGVKKSGNAENNYSYLSSLEETMRNSGKRNVTAKNDNTKNQKKTSKVTEKKANSSNSNKHMEENTVEIPELPKKTEKRTTVRRKTNTDTKENSNPGTGKTVETGKTKKALSDSDEYMHQSLQNITPKRKNEAFDLSMLKVPGAKLKIIPLGGLNEVGKNMTVIEYGYDIIIVDCGLGFPDEEMLGIDLVIPDITYLENNEDRIRGMVLTHGHEDHIGAIPYILRKINPPIFGTKLTLGIVNNKLKEVSLPYKPKLNVVKSGDTIKLGCMSVEFIHVNHSIADACALAIRTPIGTIVHSGDFKLDLTPVDGEIMDITRLGEIGKEGVLLLMCESTNAERPGNTPSEKKVGASLEYIFTLHENKRIVIATFSSNVHRVQQIIDTAARHGRKVAITGRSMLNIVGAAVELGYMKVPDGVLIDISEAKKYKPQEMTLITTGSQGEPMSALYRMAFGEHREITLGAGDVVVLSSSAIPGNEKLVGRIINELCKLGAEVIHDAAVEVHVSGHACQEELKLMQALIKPKYFMPIHGEYKHMVANRDLAKSMGMNPANIFISDIGKILQIDEKGASWGTTVPSGVVMVDGYGVGDVGNIVLRDRKLLSQDGLIVIVASVSSNGGYLMSGPDIVSRGFVYVRESESLMEEMRLVALDSINSCLNSSQPNDWFRIKGQVKDDLSKYIMNKTKRKPMIIPLIMTI